jgi:nucleoside-diphosphate-sugar epimerase
VHLAALISVEESMRKPDAYHETNATGSMNMLQACVEGCARRFVYISSAAVYGDPAELPLSEASPVKPISPYGATKLAPEFYASAFRSAFGLETVTLRLFNVYGPDQPLNDYSGVMTKFRERLLAGEAPIIYGDGEQSRSFIHVDDVAKAISLSLSKGVAGETFNIAAGEPVTMNSLAKTMIRLAGKAGLDPVHAPPRTGDIRHSYTKTSKANKLLGFSPSISLEEGLSGLIFR